ncbi:hypothetical protein KY284_012308 [Solanum tuberosum]|nr:hypothetical protein KY284_012308 [Solanum tuberosum]
MEPNLQENADHPSKKQPHLEMDKFERLMKEANEELYPGCTKYLGTLKSYVRNHACPVGSIEETYITNECLTFCSRYLDCGDSRSYCSKKFIDQIENYTNNKDCLFPTVGESDGGIDVFKLDEKMWFQPHIHVLFNYMCYANSEYIGEIKRSHCKRRLNQHQIDCLHFDTFLEWFKVKVNELEATSHIIKDVRVLAQRPLLLQEDSMHSAKQQRCTQTNRINRANQKMHHTRGSKSIATHEQAENGLKSTRADICLLTHKKCVDGRPLDDNFAKAIDMINERMSNNERSTDQPPHNVSLEGDVYSQVLGNEKSGYVIRSNYTSLKKYKRSLSNKEPNQYNKSRI